MYSFFYVFLLLPPYLSFNLGVLLYLTDYILNNYYQLKFYFAVFIVITFYYETLIR